MCKAKSSAGLEHLSHHLITSVIAWQVDTDVCMPPWKPFRLLLSACFGRAPEQIHHGVPSASAFRESSSSMYESWRQDLLQKHTFLRPWRHAHTYIAHSPDVNGSPVAVTELSSSGTDCNVYSKSMTSDQIMWHAGMPRVGNRKKTGDCYHRNQSGKYSLCAEIYIHIHTYTFHICSFV